MNPENDAKAKRDGAPNTLTAGFSGKATVSNRPASFSVSPLVTVSIDGPANVGTGDNIDLTVKITTPSGTTEVDPSEVTADDANISVSQSATSPAIAPPAVSLRDASSYHGSPKLKIKTKSGVLDVIAPTLQWGTSDQPVRNNPLRRQPALAQSAELSNTPTNVDGSNSMWVGDAGNGYIYSLQGSTVKATISSLAIPQGGSTPDPAFISFDPADGDVYVSDSANDIVDVLNTSGDLVATITLPVASFANPIPGPVFYDSANQTEYVSDVANGAMDVVDPSTQSAKYIPLPAGAQPDQANFDPSTGMVYEADQGLQTFVAINPTTGSVSQLSAPIVPGSIGPVPGSLGYDQSSQNLIFGSDGGYLSLYDPQAQAVTKTVNLPDRGWPFTLRFNSGDGNWYIGDYLTGDISTFGSSGVSDTGLFVTPSNTFGSSGWWRRSIGMDFVGQSQPPVPVIYIHGLNQSAHVSNAGDQTDVYNFIVIAALKSGSKRLCRTQRHVKMERDRCR